MNDLQTLAEKLKLKLAEKGYVLQKQEIPFDHEDSICFFDPSLKPTVTTTAALRVHGIEVIHLALSYLILLARIHDGLDYLQVFNAPIDLEKLWFIEDGEGGAITALLPSDY